MKLINSLLPILVVVGMAVSCEKAGPARPRSIQLVPHVSRVTKATDITTESMEAFTMDIVRDGGSAYVKGMQVKKSGSVWKTYDGTGTVETQYYWLDAVNMNFWGFAPVSMAGTLSLENESPSENPNTMEFDYVLAESVTDQDDLLISYNGENREFTEEDASGERVKKDGVSAKVDIVFHHALSKILFAVSTDDTTFASGTGISAISIVDISKGGNCVATGDLTDMTFAWTPTSETSTYTLETDTDFSTLSSDGDTVWAPGSYTSSGVTYNLYTTREAFYMIPQDLSEAEVKVGVTFTRGTETGTKYIKLNNNWEAGKYYKYKITAQNAIGDIYLACNLIVEDWTDGTTHLDL
ncbi:MAG: fimbrillin family protein [Bacteroidales bacterium]|nr:fimbrillin family protein [Bacteroidales bacterium]